MPFIRQLFTLIILITFQDSSYGQEQAKEETNQTNESKPAMEKATDSPKALIPPPVALDKQHQNDLKHYLKDTQSLLIGTEEVTLLVEPSHTAHNKGVVIFIPDWQLAATSNNGIEYLRHQLPKLGWLTIAIQPFDKPNDYPSYIIDESERKKQNKNTLDRYKTELSQLLKQIMQRAKESPGIIMIVAEGMNAAMITELYQEGKNIKPNAFVILSAYHLESDQEKTFAQALASLEIPVLDLLLHRDKPKALHNAALRKQYSNKEMKIDYRQRQLKNFSSGYYPEKNLLSNLLGWLKFMGW